MNTLFDVLLDKPLPDGINRGLMFAVFSVHFLFVLFTIGTAILAVYYFLHNQWSRSGRDFDWGKEILHTFTAHKSLAVVIGVGALLLIQVGFTVQFFTATNLFAGFWLLIILFLIISFLSLDALAHRVGGHPTLHLVWGIIGLTFLLAVPGTFVVVLVTTENAGQWNQIIQSGYQLSGRLAFHWLVRYMHVIGASIVFAGVFHYFFSKKGQQERQAAMLRWVMVGLLFQLADGMLLYLSLGETPHPLILGVLATGIVSALVLAWLLFRKRSLPFKPAVIVMLMILMPMLMTRQLLQERAIVPTHAALASQAEAYRSVLANYQEAGLSQYRQHLDLPYNDGPTIYEGSCAFCHGVDMAGDGKEATNLEIPPEALAEVHASRSYLHRQMATGVHKTGMPFFAYYIEPKLTDIIQYMDDRYHVLAPPEELPVQVSGAALEEARRTFGNTCYVCHGLDGTGETEIAHGITPRPPDLTQFTLSPDYAFRIISEGYPNTDMVGFSYLPEETRWGLVSVVHDLYQGDE